MELKTYKDYLVQWLQEQVKKTNKKGLIIGISGGIDSAVCASLIKTAFPENHLAVIMPCESAPIDEQLAWELSSILQLNTIKINLTTSFQTLETEIKKQLIPSINAMANSKARLRMTTLYALAQTNDYLVVGSDNADELYVGYFTKYGDGGTDIMPIAHLLKRDIRKLAKMLLVPETIINRAPTAGLIAGQTDEQELGFSYEQLDQFLAGGKVDQEIEALIERWHQQSEHKRNLPLIPEIKI